jgi:hypothetical protein
MMGLEETRQQLDAKRQAEISEILGKRHATKLKDLKPPDHLRGERLEIWEAFNTSKNAKAFEKNLNRRGMFVARATAEDALASKTESWAAERAGRYSPVLKENEYIVVTPRGRAYQLNDRSVGIKADVAQAFMKPLDSENIYNLRELRAAIEEDRISRIPRWRGFKGNSRSRFPGGLDRPLERTGKTVLGLAATASDLFESVISRPLSPQQKLDGELAQQQKKREAERERNKGFERD